MILTRLLGQLRAIQHENGSGGALRSLGIQRSSEDLRNPAETGLSGVKSSGQCYIEDRKTFLSVAKCEAANRQKMQFPPSHGLLEWLGRSLNRSKIRTRAANETKNISQLKFFEISIPEKIERPTNSVEGFY
ncbi:uncharacterized protein AKAW2_50500A [Aspergillus luchuensis]|uniref:Uncharacterized protein n=1 Tax=Aspergillus kawachii TaxID=1069201 RepID=A0A7R7ZZ33_ASPKA|nr:uncharacterized protein AKAW2_50500A [Aspergillus luchuensis]BCS00159.1 hypothetical protein AKAW2_50500A [Aspergillus luchuensis]